MQFSFDRTFDDADEIVPRTADETYYRKFGLAEGADGYLRVRSAVGSGADRRTSSWSAFVAGMPAKVPTPTVRAREECADWANMWSGEYQLVNNVWNKGAVTDYEQCLVTRVVDGQEQYGWRWQWPPGGDEAKAYPQVIFGHSPWGEHSTTAVLPRQVSSLESMEVNYALDVAADGDYSVVFAMRVTSTDPPKEDTITHHIDIVVDSSVSGSSGSRRVEFDGTVFGVSSHRSGGVTSVTFESRTPHLAGTLDLHKFLDYLVDREELSAANHLVLVEMGTHITSGAGALWMENYEISISSTADPPFPPPPAPDSTPPPLDPTPVLPAEEACVDWDVIQVSDYDYVNNVWNKGNIVGDEQCVMRRVVGGETQYGWRWNWPYQGEGGALATSGLTSELPFVLPFYHAPSHEVRAYPEVIYGRHPWRSPTTPDLPLRISSVREIRVDYEAYMVAEGDYNLAFSMWVTRDNPPTPDGVTHEIMIWVDRTDWLPSGHEHHVDEATIDGADYAVFVRQNPKDPEGHPSWVGQKYIAFAKYTDQFSGTLRLDQFLDYLVEEGHVPDDHYVTVVELGNEVLDGSRGELWLKTFQVSVR